MSKLIYIFFILVTTISYSQEYPKVIVLEKDTCIVFTLEQGKKLIEWDIMFEECIVNLELTLNESILKDSIISNQNFQISEYQKIDSLYQQISVENREIKLLYEEETKLLKKQLKKQKRQTFFASALGIISAAVLTTLIIIK
jgi:hypothetical protein